MTNEEAIKYLRQLYPYGGHCWLDEQRIEAIDMAIDALKEEPVSGEKLSNVQRTVKNLNKDFENALAEEWKGYNDRGAAKVDALEDNTQELAFAKGFYRGWHYKKEKTVSEDLEEASKNYALNNTPWDDCKDEIQESFKAGANWKEKQFEKNRIAACDRQTEEEAEREQDFVMGIIENEHRKPTFDDAIKYGIGLQKEQMMAKAIDVEVKVDAGGYPYIPQIELYDYDNDVPFAKEGDKYKVVLVKED